MLYCRNVIFGVMLACLCARAGAQDFQYTFSLEEVIAKAHQQSPQALVAKHNFRASYWEFRSYEASRLPSLNLSGTIGNYDRSLVPLQDPETGEIRYVANNNLRNRLTLSLNQNIPLTGGTLSVNTDLARTDQYDAEVPVLYNSQPISISYLQPLNGYNAMRWAKEISPKEYEQAKRVYLEAMEAVTLRAAELYFDMLLAARRLDLAQKNYTNTETNYRMAQERFKIQSVTQSDLYQLELRLTNDGLAINTNRVVYDRAMFALRSFLGYTDLATITLRDPGTVPDLTLDYVRVIDHIYQNSSFALEQEIRELLAEESVARARSERGVDLTFNARFGLTQQGTTFPESYRNPMDQEVVSLGVRLPLIDWGRGRGRVKMAQSQEEVIRTQIEQAHTDLRQRIMMDVFEFNNQGRQCALAARADSISQERYRITMERFANGSIGVIELNTAQSEKDEAVTRYLAELRTFWTAYYTLRRQSLYDYITETDISAEFDKIVEN
jgi:outer membrane protein TolC